MAIGCDYSKLKGKREAVFGGVRACLLVLEILKRSVKYRKKLSSRYGPDREKSECLISFRTVLLRDLYA